MDHVIDIAGVDPAVMRFRMEKEQEHKALRDKFAMAALTGLLSNQKLASKCLDEGGAASGWFEINAYAYADAMMKAREAK